MNVVQETLWEVRAHYRNLGLVLGLSPGDIDAIELSNQYKVDACFGAVLKSVLNDGVSHEKLASALESKTVPCRMTYRFLIANKVRMNFQEGMCSFE